MPGMIRGRLLVAAPLLLLGSAAISSSAGADMFSVQEAILRAKPATVLVITEVTSEVSVNCGGGLTKVSPNPFRETGTG